MKRDEQPAKQAVSLPNGQPAPYIDPRVPREALTPAEAYAAGLAARQARAKLPKVQSPVAGGPGPSIPRLDGAPVQPGLTMEQSAQADRAPVLSQMNAPEEGGRFVEPPSPTPMTGPIQLDIKPLDILPDRAKEDPKFQEGHGAMFAINQPHLAAKYGVIRNGQILAPQQLIPGRGEKRHLRPETVRDIQKLKELQEAQNAPQMPADAPGGQISDAAAAAGTVGNLPGDDSNEPLSPKEREAVNSTLSRMDEFQFDQWRTAMMKDILNNPEQKEIIESRLEPMDVGDLVTEGHIIQRVEIVPGKFWVEFKTQDGETDLALKRLVMEDANVIGEITDRYYLDRFALMSVAAALYSVNNRVYPEHRNDKGDFDDDKFRKKFNLVLKLPFHMLASIGLNGMWFDQRVRALFKAEKLGNG